MDITHIATLSVIEGLTEFLPVSSTAHQILVSHLLSMPQTDFLATFEIAIQVGAIAAVTVIYYKKILSNKILFYKACIGFIPTGVIGFFLFKYIKELLSNSFVPVLALFLGGIAIIGIEMWFKRKNNKQSFTSFNPETKNKSLEELKYKDALVIGLIQSISMIPGVSRSAASILGAMALKFDRESAVEFSFLLAIPTMIAATGLDILKSAPSFTATQILDLLLGTVIAFITALITIRWLLKYVKNNNFIGFGIYRIVIAIIYYFIFFR
jgi:undecaprenyl-diphosphatase